MKLRPFLFFTIISAIVIAGCAALFSVTGISSLFAGYKLQVAIMAGSLEAGKIVLASILYRYWRTMARMMKVYMAIALLVLMVITSAGIFGYLSDAYQQIRGDYTIVEKQIEGLNLKRDRYSMDMKGYQTEKGQLDNQINNIIIALQGNVIQYTDTLGQVITTQSSTARRLYRRELDNIQSRKSVVSQKIDAYSDSLIAIDLRTIELESKNIKGELGPLIYLSVAFGTDMDTVVKWFIFILIFVFDPLAVALIVAANMIYMNKGSERKEWVDMFEKKENKINHGPFDEPDNEDDGKNPQIPINYDVDPKPKVIETMDIAVENFKVGKVSEPIEIVDEKISQPKIYGPIVIEKNIPADIDAKILVDNKQEEEVEPDVNSEADSIKKEAEIKKLVKRTWKSNNWREPD